LVVGGTISGGAGMGSFRNRIINGDMRIAQRGTSSTTVGYGSVDRWSTSSSVVGTVTQSQQTLVSSDAPYQLGFKNSVRYTITTPLTSVTYQYQGQGIEGYNILDLNWGTSYGSPVTISFWFRSNVPTGSTMCCTFVPNGSGGASALCRFTFNFTLISSGNWQYVTYTIPPPPSGLGVITNTITSGLNIYIHSLFTVYLTSVPGTWEGPAAGMFNVGSTAAYQWWNNAGNYIEFTGVQLERGTVATPFEVRNYAQELALCYRYYQQFQGTSDPYHTFALGQCVSGTQAWTYFRFLQPMRTPPTLTSSAVSNFCLNNSTAGAIYPLTALAINANDSSGVECARLDATASTAVLTAGNATLLRGNNTTSAYIGLNAEL